MFSDTQFWRLVWKEYRVQRPLWLVMAIAPLLIQGAILLIAKLMSSRTYEKLDDAQVNLLMSVSYLASSVYLLGCCATIFSVEHETGTFDFQKMMPVTQRQIFWSKVGFAAVSSLLLIAILSLITRVGMLGLLIWLFFDTDTPGISVWFDTYGMLYLAELSVWSVLSSLLIRHPLWAVIVAISVQSSMMQLVIPYFVTGKYGLELTDSHDEVKRLVARWGVLLLTAVADVVIGKLWYEDRLRLPRWRYGLQPDIAPSYPAAGELPPYLGQRQTGWSRLMWLGWRDARWVVGAVLLWYACCLRLTPTIDQWHALMLPYFIGSFVCGLFSFGSEQWGGRFRFATERGCTPRIVWLSRHVTWLPPVVLMTLGGAWLCWFNPQVIQRNIANRQFEWSTVLLGPFVCYSAAQFAAMMCRSTVMALAVGLFLTISGIFWSIGMTSWLAPIWWSIGAWPVIGLFVTWLKANDWIEERRERVARWRLALGLGVPICLLLITLVTYRVIQIPIVALPPEWGEEGELKPLTVPESETLDIYRRAIAQMEAAEKRVASYETRRRRSLEKHSDWTDTQHHSAAFKGFHKDWLTEQSPVVSLLLEAHSHAPVPLALLQPDLTNVLDDDWMPDKTAQFSWLMIQHAQQTLEAGQLDEAWREFEVTLELLRRYRRRASPASLIGYVDQHELRLWELIADWGRHRDQSRDRIIRAIRHLEAIQYGSETASLWIHSNLLTAQQLLSHDARWQKHIQRNPYSRHLMSESSGWRTFWLFQPWERWRTERVLRWQASLINERSIRLLSRMQTNQSVSRYELFDTGFVYNSRESTLSQTTRLPMDISSGFRFGLTVLAQVESFRATMLLLALADFHREHNRYPESLTELVPTYFAEVPRDPRTAGLFVYFHRGIPENVTITDPVANQEFTRVLVPRDVPFLWTPGMVTNIFARALPNGAWEFVDDHSKVQPPSDALKHTKVWLLENTADGPK